jgi:type IV pilus assembly protein PilW
MRRVQSGSPRRAAGVTLVELMVAVVLGLLITGAVITLFLHSKRNFNQDSEISEMQENGRYAMFVLANDLGMAGYWGGMLGGDAVCVDPPLLATGLGADCGSPWANTTSCSPPSTIPWGYATNRSVGYLPQASAATASAAFPCIAMGEIQPNTEVLSVKRVDGTYATAAADLVSNAVYLRTNGTDGTLVRATGSVWPPPATYNLWRYRVHVYYIRQGASGLPALYRKELTAGATPTMQDEAGGVADGIEYFHVEFGIDEPKADMTPNVYVASPTCSPAPSTPSACAQLDDAVTARIYVLARSRDQDFSYANDKTYTLGSVVLGPFDDHYYRRVYETTVMLRNPAYLHNFPG